MTMGHCATLFEEDAFVAKVISLVFLCCLGPVSSLCLGLGIGLIFVLGLGLQWQRKLVEVFHALFLMYVVLVLFMP